jgi:hypothetical protein
MTTREQTCTPIHAGSTVEILPAYEMDTGYRSNFDEISGVQAEVLRICGRDAEVRILNGDECFVSMSRLKRI